MRDGTPNLIVTIAVTIVLAGMAVSPATAQTITYVGVTNLDIGSGLQSSSAIAQLSTSQHGGITVRRP